MAETVLLLDGQAIQSIPIARQLKANGYRVVLLCKEKYSYGYHTRYADKKILCPDQTKDEGAYLEFVIDYLRNNSIDVIIPMNDDSAIFLCKYKDRLSEFSKFIIPNEDVFWQAYDKNNLMAICKRYNFPHPLTIDLNEEGLKEVKRADIFPAIIKPNITSGGRGMKIVADYAEFERVYKGIIDCYGNSHLQKYINQNGRQFKVQLFIGNDGRLVASSVMYKKRYYPEKGGSSCFNETIREDNLVDICYRVLQKIGWYGFADFDMIEDIDDGIAKIMEINPRIPACIGSALNSGIDYGTMIADATLGKPVKEYIYSPGKSLRHLGFDILWFIYSPDRFKRRHKWFNFTGKNLSYQDFSWRDIKPFIFGTYGNIKKQLSPEFRKSKSGTH